MKTIVSIFFTSILILFNLNAQNAIFLHHSTGGAVYSDGHVEQWIANYNTSNGTTYEITEMNYPNTPYPWNNYPYDFWNLWVNNDCNPDTANIACLETIAEQYDVIIFKHCFPGAGIGENTGSPDITSDNKTLENYKLQYRALRDEFQNYPNNRFIVWTLAPLHRNATDVASASRAKEFVDWVKNDWLTEVAGDSFPNIYIFDFWGYVAESNPTPAHGLVNCLKYDYEGDHDGSDSHPNTTANEYVGPLFARFIVDVMSGNPISSLNHIINADYDLFYNNAYKQFKSTSNSNLLTGNVIVEVFDITGKKVDVIELSKGTAQVQLKPGMYFACMKVNELVCKTIKFVAY
jgi:hypothetical protein